MKIASDTNSTRRKIRPKQVQAALQELQSALEGIYGKETPRVLVYGSYARQEATEYSDIDVMLLYEKSIQPGQEINRISPILADLNLKYQLLISILPVVEDEYNQGDGIFWASVRHEGVQIESD